MLSLIWIGSIIATIFVASYKNLSIAGFSVLSILTGPLGLIIVLLVPANSKTADSPENILNMEEARSQLGIIKQSLASLQGKVNALEKSINAMTGKKQSEPTLPTEALAPVEKVAKKRIKTESREGFELVFGKYWLNRIGVILFVLGMGFFVSYTFQYLNAFAKVAVGYTFSAGFFVWGNSLEKKKKYTKVAWGILAGGWALLYLTTYAMHYIHATRIIANPLIELWLLALVSVVVVVYNLKYKTWIVTWITYFLALITIGLGDMNSSTIILCTLLVSSIVYLTYKMKWHTFLLVEIICCYLTYFYWLNPKLATSFLITQETSIPVYQFKIGFGILLVSWTLWTLALFLLETKGKKETRPIVLGNLLNAGFFILLGLHELYKVHSHLSAGWDERFWFLVIMGTIYFILAFLYKRLGLYQLIVICCSIAFSVLAMSTVIRFPRLSIAFFWILEMIILFGLGLYYKEWIYRMLAGFASLFIMIRLFSIDYQSYKTYTLFGIDFKHRILIFVFAILCFYAIRAITRTQAIGKVLKKDEDNLYNAYPIFGTILFTFLLGSEINRKWLSLGWTLQGSAILGLGFLLKSRVFRLCALCVLSLACLRVIFIDIMGLNTIYKIIAFTSLGAILLTISLVYSRFVIKNK